MTDEVAELARRAIWEAIRHPFVHPAVHSPQTRVKRPVTARKAAKEREQQLNATLDRIRCSRQVAHMRAG